MLQVLVDLLNAKSGELARLLSSLGNLQELYALHDHAMKELEVAVAEDPVHLIIHTREERLVDEIANRIECKMRRVCVDCLANVEQTSEDL